MRVPNFCAAQGSVADVTIIEGLRLGHVQAGSYFFVCLPLYAIGLEAAPARAILMSK